MRHLHEAAFVDALWELQRKNPRFRFVPTLTRLASSNGDWKGKTGRITSEMLLTEIATARGPAYYIAGPPAMVAATRLTLLGLGADEDDIRTEEFAGY